MGSRRNRNEQADNENYNNNAGFGNGGSPGGAFNMNNLGQMLNNLDLGQIMGQLSQMMGSPPGGQPGNPAGGGIPGGFQSPRQASGDPRMQLLQTMKPFLSARRARMLDSISQLYNIAKIVRKIK